MEGNPRPEHFFDREARGQLEHYYKLGLQAFEEAYGYVQGSLIKELYDGALGERYSEKGANILQFWLDLHAAITSGAQFTALIGIKARDVTPHDSFREREYDTDVIAQVFDQPLSSKDVRVDYVRNGILAEINKPSTIITESQRTGERRPYPVAFASRVTQITTANRPHGFLDGRDSIVVLSANSTFDLANEVSRTIREFSETFQGHEEEGAVKYPSLMFLYTWHRELRRKEREGIKSNGQE